MMFLKAVGYKADSTTEGKKEIRSVLKLILLSSNSANQAIDFIKVFVFV